VKKLPKDDLAAIRAMVNLECLGTSPPKIWAHRAEKRLLSAYIAVAKALHLVAAASNVEKVGDDASHPFPSANVPAITIHSITQDTYPVLHTNRDSLKAIHAEDYYTAYRVTALFLAYLDSALE
jgi:peptidase M28-like protein